MNQFLIFVVRFTILKYSVQIQNPLMTTDLFFEICLFVMPFAKPFMMMKKIRGLLLFQPYGYILNDDPSRKIHFETLMIKQVKNLHLEIIGNHPFVLPC